MTEAEPTALQAGALQRIVVLLYGLISYVIGVAGLAALVALVADLVPVSARLAASLPMPIVVNLTLVAIWGVIHTGMARQSFKRVLTRFIPEPAERSTYVLVAGVTSLVLVGLWQELPTPIWSVEQPILAMTLWGLFIFGWVYCLGATFAINHFDLFGLRQVFLHYRGEVRPPLNFVKRAMYRFSRHPIQTGVLIGVWATPHMTLSHLLLSLGFTGYIFVGLWFEERDLIRDIGEPYEAYRQETGKLLPKLR